jgi:AcrR family transcriptional regulator
MHLDTEVQGVRSREILSNIRKVFAEKGFDGASMQDLARAASMSAGNFYRYFPSKAAIIEAMVQQNLSEMQAEFQRIKMADDPQQAVRDLIRKHVTEVDCEKGPIWAEIEATAFRRPEIAALLDRVRTQICHNIVGLFAHIAGMGEDDARRRFGAKARLIFLTINAYSIATARDLAHGKGPKDADFENLVIGLIENSVGEVAANATLAPVLETVV